MSVTRFVPRPGPPLAAIGLRPHDYRSGGFSRCRTCEMPKSNRVHDPAAIEAYTQRAAEWAQRDAERLGERDW